MRRLNAVIILLALSGSASASVMLDRIVATVDKQAITRSDVEEEARFSHLVDGKIAPITQPDEVAALGRLVDRDLVAEQVAVFGLSPVAEKELQARLTDMRKQIPGAESDAGWRRLLQEHRLTEEDV
jgi:parvulin-like peptidyl-prolyl isomerase